MAEDRPREAYSREDTMEEHSFDELARGLASGTLSRGRVLKLVGAVILSTALMPWFPSTAQALTARQRRQCVQQGGAVCGARRRTEICCPAGQACCGTSRQPVCCASGETCMNGTCETSAPPLCSTTNPCPTTGQCCSNGQCVSSCPSGETCVNMMCQPAECPSGQILCAEGCVDPLTDNRNCGGCGNLCFGNACCGGRCCGFDDNGFSLRCLDPAKGTCGR